MSRGKRRRGDRRGKAIGKRGGGGQWEREREGWLGVMKKGQ